MNYSIATKREKSKGIKMTNAKKFKEVFGFEIATYKCVCNDLCTVCPCYQDYKCQTAEYWESEYKEPKEKVADEKDQIDVIFEKCKIEQNRSLEAIRDIINSGHRRIDTTSREDHLDASRYAVNAIESNAKWKEAVEKIKTEIDQSKDEPTDEESKKYNLGLDVAKTIVKKHTKDLIEKG